MTGPGLAPSLSLLQAGCGGLASVTPPGGFERRSLGFCSCLTPRAAKASLYSLGVRCTFPAG